MNQVREISGTAILVPIKNTSTAKQRLSSILDQPSRTKLAQAMLHDVLTALHECLGRRKENDLTVAIVSSDPFATEVARGYKFQVIPDPANRKQKPAPLKWPRNSASSAAPTVRS